MPGSRPTSDSATADPPAREAIVEEAARTCLSSSANVWATGETTWSQAIGARLGELGWRLATVEIGTAGSFGALIGDADWFRFDEAIAVDAPAAEAHAPGDLISFARRARGSAAAKSGGHPRRALGRHGCHYAIATRSSAYGQAIVSRPARSAAADRAVGAAYVLVSCRRADGLIDTGAMRRTGWSALVSIALVAGACSTAAGTSAGSTSDQTEVTSMPSTTFSLLSTAFDDGGPIPSRFTCDGANASPDLTWSGAPDGTRALVLIVTDPDAGAFVHWLDTT
jgi:hypothetical protein